MTVAELIAVLGDMPQEVTVFRFDASGGDMPIETATDTEDAYGARVVLLA